MDRRGFLIAAVTGGGAVAVLGPAFWRTILAGPSQPGAGPYGPLQAADSLGMMLPAGFTARVVAIAGEPVGGTSYAWHSAPDGAAIFPSAGGGWLHAVNSELSPGGGVSVIRYGSDAAIMDAYRVLGDTSQNCAGGATPWGTWLSCEETPVGRVWECDPTQPGQGIVRPALGMFSHEAVAVDPIRRRLYLTEDHGTGHYYRFTAHDYPDLSNGVLEAAVLDPDGNVSWTPVVAELPAQAQPQVSAAATAFSGGEGIWYDPAGGGYVYFTTKGDDRVWVHDLGAATITVLYDPAEHDDPPLTGVDNVVVAPSGDVLVGEDGGNLEIVLFAAETQRAAPIMRLTGPEHEGSEITGPCFSPDGTRLYFSSQRGGTPGSGMPGSGVTYEVTGPFRTQRVGIAAVGPVPVVTERLAGSDRFETAVEVSHRLYPQDQSAGAVVIARGDEPSGYADALAGVPFAHAQNAPLLVVLPDRFPDATRNELARVLAPGRTAYLLGGEQAVSPAVEAAIESMGYTTERIFGDDRFGTAVAIANRLGDLGTLLLTTGFDFPDAIAAGAAAAAVHGAVLLTGQGERADATDAYLEANPDQDVYAIGAPAAQAYPSATPIVGSTREETATLVAETFYDRPTAVGIARRDGFPDALSGGVLMARLGGPMLLTPSTSLDDAASRYVCDHNDSITQGKVFGGTTAVSPQAAATLDQRLRGSGC